MKTGKDDPRYLIGKELLWMAPDCGSWRNGKKYRIVRFYPNAANNSEVHGHPVRGVTTEHGIGDFCYSYMDEWKPVEREFDISKPVVARNGWRAVIREVSDNELEVDVTFPEGVRRLGYQRHGWHYKECVESPLDLVNLPI